MKIIKNLFVIALFLTALLSSTVTLKASDMQGKIAVGQLVSPENFGDPISETTYDADDGTQITEKIYYIPIQKTSVSTFSLGDVSGEGWYKKEKVKEWENGKYKMTYYAKGYFVWGNGSVTLKTYSTGINGKPAHVVISDRKVKVGTNSVMLSFKAKGRMQKKASKYSVKISVNSRGIAY